MPYHIHLAHDPNQHFDASDDETILDAALRQGIEIPFSCHAGICTTCKGKVITGQYDYGEHDIVGIDPNNTENDVLFCCAYPRSDLTISHHAFKMSAQTLTTRLIKKDQLSQHITALKIETPKGFTYQAGQYLSLLHCDQRYPFSIANAPGNDYLELHIQVAPHDQACAQLLHTLSPEDTITLIGPEGNAYLRHSGRPLLLIAGGSGLAPMKAIIEQTLQEDDSRDIHLFWGVRHSSFLYHHSQLLNWARYIPHFSYTPVVSEHEAEWSGKSGLVHQVAMTSISNCHDYDIYLAGPFDMAFEARDDFKKAGVNSAHLYADAFAFA